MRLILCVTASSPPALHGMSPKHFPFPYFDASFHPFIRAAYFPGESLYSLFYYISYISPQSCWFDDITVMMFILTYWIQIQNTHHNYKAIRTFLTLTQLLTALEFCKGRDCEIMSRQFRRPCLAKCSDCWHFVLLIYKLVRIFTVRI